jgi:hypothetical protein
VTGFGEAVEAERASAVGGSSTGVTVTDTTAESVPPTPSEIE